MIQWAYEGQGDVAQLAQQSWWRIGREGTTMIKDFGSDLLSGLGSTVNGKCGELGFVSIGWVEHIILSARHGGRRRDRRGSCAALAALPRHARGDFTGPAANGKFNLDLFPSNIASNRRTGRILPDMQISKSVVNRAY